VDRARRGGSPRRGVVEARVDATRRPNECPRCGFVYSSFNRPKPQLQTSDIRILQNPLAVPWQCCCGTWLRTRPLSFGWVDIAGLLILTTIEIFGAVRFWWLRSGVIFFLPIGAWLTYRTSRQDAIEEVPGPGEERTKVA
jgi:hypothetical protein